MGQEVFPIRQEGFASGERNRLKSPAGAEGKGARKTGAA